MFVDSPEEVHKVLSRAVRAGANILRGVTQLGHYGSHACFASSDGHIWEVLESPGFLVDESGSVFVE
jgi:predicted lactoylglutathione lyase